jgi:hypothetical protein
MMESIEHCNFAFELMIFLLIIEWGNRVMFKSFNAGTEESFKRFMLLLSNDILLE